MGVMSALAACTTAPARQATPPGSATPTPTLTPTSTPTPTPTPVVALPARIALPGGTLTGLPGEGNLLALTVDDGADSEVVAGYAEFMQRTGFRATFFLNGIYDSWTEQAGVLRPLVESGVAQLANHTFSHPDLTELTDSEVVEELQSNENFIRTTYGVSGAPYFRPPFGYHDDRVDAAAASVGYTQPVLWYGSLSDSGLITADQLRGFADQYLLAQHIVIGHANFPPVLECLDYIQQLVVSRALRTVTLDDVFEVENRPQRP
ncbi:polysaccharide deacetylase [Pseudoclavibacter sp. RFBB5]|jgi:peptidoglycan/xylan/chitin deacetylase (PgdA/CDA1 family)|nr:polysaccharide deacetylase [Pseudoclavibacter sp. RFBB5]